MATIDKKFISSVILINNLTIEGIEEAVDYLRKCGKNIFTSVQKLKGFTYQQIKLMF